MNHREFQIGMEFTMSDQRWRCTDVGTRMIIAIKLTPLDDSRYAGPAYAVAEVVLDKGDLEVCSTS